MNLREKGWEGEKVAQVYLLKRGYEILKTNWYTRYGEADIIAKTSDGVIVIVEVKTYHPNSAIDPREVITPKKQQRMVQVAQYFMMQYCRVDTQFRFDLIVVERDRVLHHLENIIS